MSPIMKISTLLMFAMAGVVAGFAGSADLPGGTVQGVDADTVPCRIIEGDEPNFPLRMLNEGVTNGEVHILLYVDSTGTLTDTLVTAYSRKPFADEALRVVEGWKFTVGRMKGQPVDTIFDLTFNFEAEGVVIVRNPTQDAAANDWRWGRLEYSPATVESLDRVPTPLNVVEPTFPHEWMKQGIVGTVTVDFYIDESGRTRFPIVAPGPHEQLVGIALAAVKQWQFIPPKSKGRPVLVRARQVFRFEADDKG